MSLELIAGACIGATLGLISGIIISKKMGLTPSAKELEKALEANESYYKQTIQRFKGRLKEYEQPSELQRLAHQTKGAEPENIIAMLANELPNIRGLPGWIRPLVPGIQAYLKDNPEQVMELITKFTSKTTKDTTEGSMDYL